MVLFDVGVVWMMSSLVCAKVVLCGIVEVWLVWVGTVR